MKTIRRMSVAELKGACIVATKCLSMEHTLPKDDHIQNIIDKGDAEMRLFVQFCEDTIFAEKNNDESVVTIPQQFNHMISMLGALGPLVLLDSIIHDVQSREKPSEHTDHTVANAHDMFDDLLKKANLSSEH